VRCQAVRGRATRGWDARGQELQDWSGGAGSDGWRGVGRVAWAGRARARVDRLGAWGSVGLLGPGDGIAAPYIY
jgi:hypothetical protein